MSSAELASLVTRLEAAVSRLEKSAGGAGDAGEDECPKIVSEYNFIITDYIDKFVAASANVEYDAVKEAASLVKQIAQEQSRFLAIVAKCSAPSQAELVKLIQPCVTLLGKIEKLKDSNFKNLDVDPYTKAINEGAAVFGWITMTPAPSEYVKGCKDSAMFYTNKILKMDKDKDWVKSWLAIFNPMYEYVKEYHRTGLSWNKQGPAASATAVGAPPPPPPPPPPSAVAIAAPATKSGPNVAALLGDLNKGADVTRGLKKVSDDMKTHKNPNLRKGATVPAKAPAVAPKPSFATKKPAVSKPPVLALEGKKWIVEYQKNQANLVLGDVSMKQTVYIYKCENCTITIQGKVNSITLDGCKKTGVVFESVVSGVDFVNCQSVKGQVTGVVPIVSIDKTDGCHFFLNEKSLNCQIVTAKSSEMNISVPKGEDFAEYPIVEQFKTTWNGKEFITEPNESAE